MAQTYRQWLQDLANNSSYGLPQQEASALLQVVGDDGNVNNAFEANPYAYTKNSTGHVVVKDTSGADYGYGPQSANALNDKYYALYQQNVGKGGGGGGGGTGTADPDAATRTQLRNRIAGRQADVENTYNDLFSSLDNLGKSRDSELEAQYGDQLKNATDTYTSAIPEIEKSYAALGAGDSTDQGDAKDKAKTGFDTTTKTIGDNKNKDKAALGEYLAENKAKFQADHDSAMREIANSGSTTDVDALRGLSNDLDTNLGQAGVTKATLAPDAAARQTVTSLTADNGRYDAAVNALDSIIKSSMSNPVKQAAVTAVTSAGGLTDEEKKKVNNQFGNVFAEQAAL